MWISSSWRHLSLGLGKSFLTFLFRADNDPLFAQCAGWLEYQPCAGLLLLCWAESAGVAPNTPLPLQVQALKPYLQIALGTVLRAKRKPARTGQLWPECTCRKMQGHPLQTLFRLACHRDGVPRILGSLLCSQLSFWEICIWPESCCCVLTLKCKIQLLKPPFNPYDCNMSIASIWGGCWACILKTSWLYFFFSWCHSDYFAVGLVNL